MLVDKNGNAHRTSLPQGFAHPSVVSELHARAKQEVHPMLAKLVEVTPEPFMQTIVDIVVPKTVFGRVMLTGDSLRSEAAHRGRCCAYDALVLGESRQRALERRCRVGGGRGIAAGIWQQSRPIWRGARRPLGKNI